MPFGVLIEKKHFPLSFFEYSKVSTFSSYCWSHIFTLRNGQIVQKHQRFTQKWGRDRYQKLRTYFVLVLTIFLPDLIVIFPDVIVYL